jgi:hypothetical protein
MLRDYLDARESEMKDTLILQSQEKLWKAEDIIAVTNILMTFLAIKQTYIDEGRTALGWKRVCQGMADRLNAAQDEINKNGIQKIYEQIHNETGINLEFDSMDMNREFGFAEHDFREDGFDGKTGIEIWNEAWETADRLANLLNTMAFTLALKREFGFSTDDFNKVVKISNNIIKTAQNGSGGVTAIAKQLQKECGADISDKDKELLRRYGL